MAGPSLSQLRVFLSVAEQGSFSSAAAELGMSQSSLSEAVRSLEKALGKTLFKRGPHGTLLSEAGEKFFEHALRSVQAADDLEKALQGGEHGNKLSGELKLATFRSIGTYVLPAILARLKQLYPAVNVTVLAVSSDSHAQQLLQRGQADAVLTSLPLSGPLLSWPLLSDPYVLLTSKQRGPHPFQFAELRHTPLLLPSEHDSCAVKVFQYLQAQSVSPSAVQHIDEDSVVLGMVQHGLGVSIMSVLTAQPLLPGIQVLALPAPLERSLGLSVLATRASLPLLQALVKVAGETAERTFNVPAGQLYPAV
ncbi:LysR family transcriptional regulator [Deinococcus psychrotolerans]|uniref:LysR family transcriptional regulator n=1 Tax=Deinococcus psychrotolerans TaxID=2489213 RepID=A0A3G8Y8D8_9DEIO|nr:LysR family transcriptional regulator [Deinococcus psychrotolerans]AZI41632.1 LysR family transcriptional regulator [Deinococcus psychrotolerans]